MKIAIVSNEDSEYMKIAIVSNEDSNSHSIEDSNS